MSFWFQFDEEHKANDPAHPPLTDELLKSLEAMYGVRFPARLIKLLREKNGGPLANRSFKWNGASHIVESISGLAAPDKWSNIKPASRLFQREDYPELYQEIKAKAGNPDLIFPFGDFGGHCLYSLDYNHALRGEPTVILLVVHGDVRVENITRNFDEFLDGHYFGDAQPAVNLEEISKHKVLYQSQTSGRHLHGGAEIQVSHWVCGQGANLCTYTRMSWNGKLTLRKSVVAMRSLEPEVCVIEKVGYIGKPAAYELYIHMSPGSSGEKVSVEDSEQAGTLWKNTRTEILYDTVWSHSRKELDTLRQALFPGYDGKPRSAMDMANEVLGKIGIS